MITVTIFIRGRTISSMFYRRNSSNPPDHESAPSGCGCPRQVCDLEVVLQTPKPRKLNDTRKWLESDFWGPGQSDSKVTYKRFKVTFWTILATFESLLNDFWVTLAGTPKVTFESLFCVFELSDVSGSVGPLPGHNAGGLVFSPEFGGHDGRSRPLTSDFLQMCSLGCWLAPESLPWPKQHSLESLFLRSVLIFLAKSRLQRFDIAVKSPIWNHRALRKIAAESPLNLLEMSAEIAAEIATI